VIVTPVGGMLDGVNDANSLITIIQEVLSDKPLQKHLVRSARQTVKTKFILQKEIEDSLEL
jgi:glycosyltransferase involved in cell wall biosynthesis